jgi:outer membrane protein OmpA-like peptidoglycan-associated protein
MSLQFRPKMKRKSAILFLAASLFGCPVAWAQAPAVQTYTNQAVPAPVPPDASYGTPLAPGQMTLEEVLETHPVPRKPSLQAPTLTSGVAPALTAPTQPSVESDMLMQGLKTALQENGTNAPLKAPQLPGATTAAATVPAPAAAPSANAPSAASSAAIQYQPGQAPKNLATNAPLNVAPTSMMPSQETTAASNASAPAGPCEPHTEKWIKSCADAGYPASFTGSIQGETHTTCPAGTLQDVWIANSCAPAGEAAASGPLSAPVPEQSTQPITMASAGAAPVVSAGGVVDGSCGPANGPAVSVKPAGDYCVSGEPGDVTGDGPWRWECRGLGGGMTVSCAAALEASTAPTPTPTSTSTASSGGAPPPAATTGTEDGQCGPANEAGTEGAPQTGLCASGIPSRVNGIGPWTWACSGRNGGQAAACSAAPKTNGECGSASGAGVDSMPMNNLCTAGYASAITGAGPWNWTCSGLYGGAAALCSATPKQNAICGTASLYGHREAPRDNLCSIGAPSAVNGGGPWTWTCNGANGGAAVSCLSPISVNGGCGEANGVAATSVPSDDLCSYGKASRVTGSGPWMWTCSGTNGGESESCTAPLGHAAAVATAAPTPTTPTEGTSAPAPSAAPAVPVTSGGNEFVSCGASAEFAALAAPTKDLCSKGEAGTVTGEGPWSWTCSDKDGHKTECSTLAPSGSFAEVEANVAKPKANEAPAPSAAPVATVATGPEKPACGIAAGEGTASAPARDLCSIGKASAVHGTGPWNWTCEKNKGKAECNAPKLLDASCGGANGAIRRNPPVSELCNTGTPTPLQGSGPWMWSCIGSGGGVSVSCSAGSQTQTRVDGACGEAATVITTKAPAANLCDGGMPSAVYGHGPWTWTCSGLNGGVASLCSAQNTAPQAPPPPGPLVNGLCGNANGVAAIAQPQEELCSAGTATQTSGNGPWNWDCIGANGGMSVSCTAPLQPPPPIVGECGSATGVPTTVIPRSGLCAAGISSAVSGEGPWTWSCSGTNGGGAVACVAPLAGGLGTGLPSMVTPSSEAPTPQAATTTPVTSTNLVTPRLTTNAALPPLAPGATPPMIPSSPFPSPPEPSAMPPVPPEEPAEAPAAMPELPQGTQALQPPPIRSTIKPSPALQPDGSSVVIPGNHAVLPEDVSVISFKPNVDNIDPSALPALDKLVMILQANAGARITLTAYAGVGPDTSPRDARRLSLTRALAIRDYLTAKGVSSARINVRALGANVPSGDPDRVDISAE